MYGQFRDVALTNEQQDETFDPHLDTLKKQFEDEFSEVIRLAKLRFKQGTTDAEYLATKSVLDHMESDLVAKIKAIEWLRENADYQRHKRIESGKLTAPRIIVAHRTDGSDSSWKPSKGVGAHFYILTTGIIKQAATLEAGTSDIGGKKVWSKVSKRWVKTRYKKSAFDFIDTTYPTLTNRDNIGIEVVGKFNENDQSFPEPTDDQYESYDLLVECLKTIYSIHFKNEVPHFAISPKSWGEGVSLTRNLHVGDFIIEKGREGLYNYLDGARKFKAAVDADPTKYGGTGSLKYQLATKVIEASN